MRAPTEKDRKKNLWAYYSDYYHFDDSKNPAIVWHDDAPKEALESYELDLKFRQKHQD